MDFDPLLERDLLPDAWEQNRLPMMLDQLRLCWFPTNCAATSFGYSGYQRARQMPDDTCSQLSTPYLPSPMPAWSPTGAHRALVAECAPDGFRESLALSARIGPPPASGLSGES